MWPISLHLLSMRFTLGWSSPTTTAEASALWHAAWLRSLCVKGNKGEYAGGCSKGPLDGGTVRKPLKGWLSPLNGKVNDGQFGPHACVCVCVYVFVGDTLDIMPMEYGKGHPCSHLRALQYINTTAHKRVDTTTQNTDIRQQKQSNANTNTQPSTEIRTAKHTNAHKVTHRAWHTHPRRLANTYTNKPTTKQTKKQPHT